MDFLVLLTGRGHGVWHTVTMLLFCQKPARVCGPKHRGWLSGTFKVHQAIPVEVNVMEDLVHLPLAEALPQQDLEGCPQLRQADAAITIGVKLWWHWSWR